MKEKNITYILDKDNFKAGIIYGIHRLGKTELLKLCFVNSKNYIIYKIGFNITNDNNYILIKLDDIYSKLD